jgi:hypothetical protein
MKLKKKSTLNKINPVILDLLKLIKILHSIKKYSYKLIYKSMIKNFIPLCLFFPTLYLIQEV